MKKGQKHVPGFGSFWSKIVNFWYLPIWFFELFALKFQNRIGTPSGPPESISLLLAFRSKTWYTG